MNIKDKNLSKESFKSLSTGLYYLNIKVASSILKYPLYLISGGASTDTSTYSASYIAYSLIEPAVIVGQAGKVYEIKVEIRTKNNLRYKYQINMNTVSVSNSLNLNSKQLIITKKTGANNGQFSLFVNQTVANVGNPNVLTITYNQYGIDDKVKLIMKPGDLSKLTLVSGYKDGSVSDLPTLKFTPWDAYGNSYTYLFDSKTYTSDLLNKLTVGKSTDGYELVTNNYVSDNKYLNVQYKTTKPTTIKLTSSYFSGTYSYKIHSGDIYPKKTTAELKTNSENKVGETYDIMIYPRDSYGNLIDNLSTEEKNAFYVYYEIEGIVKKNNVSSTCFITDEYTPSSTPRRLVTSSNTKNKIQCAVPLTTVGKITFSVKYKNMTCQYDEMSYTVNKRVNVNDPISAGVMKKSTSKYQIDSSK